MKTSMKIMLIVNILLLIANIFLIRYLIEAIVPTGEGFSFNFSALSWVALVVFVLFLISSIVLYIMILRRLSLSNLIFFSILPLALVYGVSVSYLAQVNNLTDVTAESIKATLNLNSSPNINILWIILSTIFFLLGVFTLLLIACKPLKNVEKITQNLGNGRSKVEDFKVGGSKQFQEIEHSLNKINYIYKENENKIKVASLKDISKEMQKFLGKDAITELELGRNVQKEATTLFCDLKASKTLSLEQNFNYINSFLKIVAPLVKRYDGIVDKFLGDGLLATFSKTQNAIECAHAIVKAINNRNKVQKTNISVGVSIDFGSLTFSLMEEDGKKYPTITSDILTLAMKMEEINEYIGSKVLISKKALSSLPQNFSFNFRYTGTLNHEKTQIPLYESLEYYPKRRRDKLIKMKNVFENGVRFYNERKFSEAKNSFEEVLQEVADDKPSYVYFNKASEKLQEAV